MKQLVIGYGEIGQAVYKCLKDNKQQVYKRDKQKVNKRNVEVLHICFPYDKRFKKQVKKYIDEYKPFLVMVYSTVPIGTCDDIGVGIVHSPVEGKHPKLAESIKKSPRWIGGDVLATLNMAISIWVGITTVRIVESTKATEFLKLRSTAKYGINIVWAAYEGGIAKDIDLAFDVVKEFDKDYNELYKQLGMPEYQRYILDPPTSSIGGHCIVPNAKLLNEQYPSEMLDMIIDL